MAWQDEPYPDEPELLDPNYEELELLREEVQDERDHQVRLQDGDFEQ